ncbi:hypothetical protein [Ruegeria sp.]|uniref:hypothetical protein n=1 Tax=Ruegeria sp. TaxID=1879320 RepID=UPI003B597BCF
MDALRFLGFALVVILAIAGVDYYQQDKKHEGTLSANGYVDTLKQRFALYHEELDAEQVERERKQRWRAGGKPYMPESGDGWVRRSLSDVEFTLDAREGPGLANISEAARPLARNVAVQEAKQLVSKLERTSWVYEKGDYTLWLQVSFRENASSNTLAGNIAQSIAGLGLNNSDFAPFGVIGGVAYFQFKQNQYSVITVDDRAFWAIVTATVSDYTTEPGFDIYKGTLGLGEEIRMQLYSDAPAEEVHAFLAQLDYDGMNAVLRKPVPGVANGTAANPEGEAELAANMAALRTEFVKLRGELARLRIENMDGLALVANTLAGQYGLPADTFDLTANKIRSADDLVQVGYRKGLSDLIEGQTQKAEVEGEGMFGRLFGSFKGGDDAPQTDDQSAGGFLGGLKSMFSGRETASSSEPVRVNKGGAGVTSKCATRDAFKKCTLSGG